MRVRHLLALFALLCSATCVRGDTVSVYFAFNEGLLDDRAVQKIDSALYSGRLHASQALQIIGYTDAVGGESFNLRLSRQRAEAVKAYLLQSGFRDDLITLVTGRGEAAALAAERPGGNLADRRVDIAVLPSKNVLKATTRFKLSPVPPQPAKSQAARRQGGLPDIGRLKVGETLVLENIYFYAGRHIVRKESDAALDALVEALTQHPEIKIRIEGHVCCVPASSDAIDDDTGKEGLSVNRAEAIKEYLARHGIDSKRLSCVGFGHMNPIVRPERNEEDANKNRRVEVRIMQ